MCITTSNTFIHLVEYCETDAMKIVHHAEYIKWMEYARHHFLTMHDFDCAAIEQDCGVMLPILSVSIDYKSMTRFGDTVEILTEMKKFNGVYLDFTYQIRDYATKKIRAVGSTRSGFIDREYHPILLRDSYPDYYEKLEKI